MQKELVKSFYCNSSQPCEKCSNVLIYIEVKLFNEALMHDLGRIIPSHLRWKPLWWKRPNTQLKYAIYKEVDNGLYITPGYAHVLKICSECFHIPNIPFWFIKDSK
jgi:hypothetical protein